ncbi:MAG: hypothetical protein ACI4CS_03735, partial [Candidatus Weimeria sp.]
SEIRKNDMKDDISVKTVVDFFKQSGVKSCYKLFAVIPDDEGDDYIAVAEDPKWSPYSERSRYTFMYFHEGEDAPYKTEVTPVGGTDMSLDEAVSYLSEKASEDTDLSSAIESGDKYAVEDYINGDPDKPYIIMSQGIMSALKSVLTRRTALAS